MHPPTRPDDPAQEQVREWFSRIGSEPWLPVLTSRDDEGISGGSLAALAPPSYRAEALRDPSWDLTHYSGGPGFSQASDGDHGWATTYHRIITEPVEPVVIELAFHGVRPSYRELSEEFRLYHNLYRDSATGQLFKIDDAGNAAIAVQIQPNLISVLTPLIRQYQAARQMDLLLFIDSVVYFERSLPTPAEQHWQTTDLNAVLHAGDVDGRPFTRFLATRVLTPPPVEDSGMWPYERPDDHFPDFIIGTDGVGNPRLFACDPSQLANFFGSNPDAPNYLTPVHFRRDVLVKYYNRPDLYTVEDGYLRCGSLWGLRMDNDTSDTVVVWLGDLGRDLPDTERDYWRSFNVPPVGGVSETAYRRAILGEFADAQSTDLRIRVAYPQLRAAWQARFGWPIFRNLEAGDAYLLDVVRRPLHDTETEFDDLVRTLAKLFVDSLNESELANAIPSGPKDEKGISKFNRWLAQAEYVHANRDISFLRNLQAVRSKGAAHLKGSDYQKTLDKAVGPMRNAAAGSHLLEQSLTMIRDLTAFAAAGPAGVLGSLGSGEGGADGGD